MPHSDTDNAPGEPRTLPRVPVFPDTRARCRIPPIFTHTEEGWAKEIEEEWARFRLSANRIRQCLKLARARVFPADWDVWVAENLPLSQEAVDGLLGRDEE